MCIATGVGFARKTASHGRRRIGAAPRQLRARIRSFPGTHARSLTSTDVLPLYAAVDNRRTRPPAAPNIARKTFGSDGDSKLQARVACDDLWHRGVAAITSDHVATRMHEEKSWNMLHEQRDVHC